MLSKHKSSASARGLKKLDSNFFSGVILFLFSIFTYTYLIPNYIDIMMIGNVNTTTFPKIFTGVLGLSSLVTIVASLKIKGTPEKVSIDIRRSGTVLLTLAAYYVFMDLLGYIVASVICGYLVMGVFQRSFRLSKKQITILLLVVAVIYIFFERIMNVPFPHGLLF